MTGGDENNPNRTVFRPSPLQGLKGGQAAPQPGQPFGGGTAHPGGPAAQPAPPPPSVQPGPAPRAVNDDDIPRPETPPHWRNPMLEAAAPILALAAGVRSGRVQINLPQLHQRASAAVAAFSQAITGYPLEQQQRAKYGVCATIDDIAQNLPGHAADGAEWARRSLVVQTFHENIGGDRFWQLLDDMLAKPASYPDLIELYHACLAAGFEGRYRVMPDGKSRLHEIMARAYAALQHVRSLSQTELSPHWKATPAPLRKVGFWAPLLTAGGAALVLLVVIYLLFRLVLVQTGQPSMTALRALNPGEPLRLSRIAPAPPAPPPSVQAMRLKTFLAPEIAQHLVTVDQDASTVRVRTTVGTLFKSGSDQLEPGRRALFERIGAAIETEPGPVRVEGHADSDRVSTLAFPDNFALSKARADTVAQIIKSKLSDPGRVTSEGFGDTQPIASNATPEGKALNRRVEVVIQRRE